VIKIPNDPASQLALKQQFLDRAKALSNLSEVYRSPQVTLLIRDTIAFGVRSEAEIFEAVYGDPGGREYWDACLSEPIRMYSLANVLSAHLAENVEQLEHATIVVIRAFRDAAEAGERWFVGDTSPLLALEHSRTDFERLDKVKVHPRAAVEWLLSKPKRHHLVPDSLRTFLLAGESTDATKPRRLNKQSAERFVADYVNKEQDEGRRPTLVALEAAAKEANIVGGRDLLRAAFHALVDVKRGRPDGAPREIAKK
jgi:hypothetical protein